MSEAKFDNGCSGPKDGPAAEASVTCTAVHQIAQECARAIYDQWDIGIYIVPGHGGGFERVTVDRVAERLEQTLNAINARKA